MRFFAKILVITAIAVMINLALSFYRNLDRQVAVSVPEVAGKFIVLSDSDRNEELQHVRSANCGGYEAVLSEIQRRFDIRTEQQVAAAEWNYAYTATLEVVREAVRQGSFHSSCLAMVSNSEMSETNKLVLLTRDGDIVVGYDTPMNHWYEGIAFTLWSKVDHDGWGFDTLAIADFTEGMSAKVMNEMQEVPIASVSSRTPRGQRG